MTARCDFPSTGRYPRLQGYSRPPGCSHAGCPRVGPKTPAAPTFTSTSRLPVCTRKVLPAVCMPDKEAWNVRARGPECLPQRCRSGPSTEEYKAISSTADTSSPGQNPQLHSATSDGDPIPRLCLSPRYSYRKKRFSEDLKRISKMAFQPELMLTTEREVLTG